MSATPKPGMLTAAQLLAYTPEVMAYRNLHFKAEVVYSVKDRRANKLIAYTPSLLLVNVRFVVRDSERRRAVLRHERNVHAFAIGTITDQDDEDALWLPGGYHPFKYTTFVDLTTEAPLLVASAVRLGPDGMHYQP
jgi:hypothetical protein